MKAHKFNADYEVELFHQKLAPQAVNQSIEFFLFFLSERPLWTLKTYSSQYLEYVEKITGRKPQIIHSGPFDHFWGALKDLEIERWWNSKITSTQLIIDKKWCGKTHILNQASELEFLNDRGTYLLKDPFGMSGQKFQLINCDSRSQIEKALKSGSQIIEPWFDRKYDFSQYIFPDGKVIAYENVVDAKFQYKGSTFNHYPASLLENLSFYSKVSKSEWEKFKLQTEEIIQFYSKHPNQNGYSIDSFIYHENDELKIRVMSEVNYRFTMGRVAYELSERFAKNAGWTKLLLMKRPETSQNLWEVLAPLKNVMVLSPGDSRFEIFFLFAQNADQGEELIKKINELLADTQAAIKL